MKRILALVALLWASVALAADNPIACSGANCKVTISTRNGSSTLGTAASFNGGATNSPVTFGSGNFTLKLGSTTQSAQFATNDTSGGTFGPAIELARPNDGVLVGGMQTYNNSLGTLNNLGIFSRTDIVMSSNGGEVGRFSSSGVLSAPRMTAGHFYTTVPSNLADDTALIYTPATEIGVMIIHGRNTSYSNAYAIVSYRVTATAYCLAMVAGSGMGTFGTGILTGTTGTDTKINIGCNANGNIYIENRTGGAASVSITILGS